MSGSLTHTPAQVLRYLIIDLGLGALPSSGSTWPVYAVAMPDTPDNLVMVTDTAGRQGGREMVHGERAEHPGWQVMVRCNEPRAAVAKANAIAMAFDAVRWNSVAVQELSGTTQTIYTVHAITRTSGVLPIGRETPASGRHLVTVNGIVSLRQH